MKKNTIILSLQVIGVICIIINTINRNLLGGHLMALGIILISVHFVFKQLTSKEPVNSRAIGNEKLNSVLYSIKKILMIALFVIVWVILCYYYYLKSR